MKKGVFLIVTILAFLGSSVATAGAQDFNRKGKGQFYGAVQMLGGDPATFFDGTAGIKFDDTTVYGFGFGFDVTDNININTDFLFGSVDTDFTIEDEDIFSFDSDLSLWNLNLDYNILKERLTPVLSAGLGFINFSSSDTFPNIDETDFSYNFGAGVRWDATDYIFLKAMYRWTWTELQHADDNMLFDGLSVFFGIRF